MTGKKSASKTDQVVDQVLDVLAEYKRGHRKAKIDVRRQNSVSVRIRIIDPDFGEMDMVDRDTAIWKFLERLPDVQSEITFLLLLTPEETADSLANMDFENPIPSRL